MRPFAEGNGHPLQYSCLGNPIHRGAWWAAVHGVTESDRTEAASHAWSLVADIGPALCAQYLIHPQRQPCRVVAPPCHRSGGQGSQTVSHLPGFYIQSHQDWHLNLNRSLPVLEHSTCGRIWKGAEQLGGGPGIARTGHYDIESGSIYRLMGTVRAGKRGGVKKAPLLGLFFDQTPFSRPHSPSIRPCQCPAISWVPIGPASRRPQLGLLSAHAGSKVKQLGANALGSRPANIGSESEDTSSSFFDPWGGITLGCSSPSPHFPRGVERPLFVAVTFAIA